MHEREQAVRSIETCKQNLRTIGAALAAYQKKHDTFPDWLSNLYPEYLSDSQVLLCPADEQGNESAFPENADPGLSVSYNYQFNPSYREWKTEQRQIYGEIVPVVRCRRHAGPERENLVLDLTCALDIREDLGGSWETNPETLANLSSYLKTQIRAGVSDGQTGLPSDLSFHLSLFTEEQREELNEFAEGAVESAPGNGAALKALAMLRQFGGNESEALGFVENAMPLLTKDAEIHSLAGHLYSQADRAEEAIAAFEMMLQIEPDHPRYFDFYQILCYLYTQVGRAADGNALIDRLKSHIDPDQAHGLSTLGDMLMAMERHDEAFAVYEKLFDQDPENPNVLHRLAAVHEALGNAALAREYRIKADPALVWVGEKLPDFSVADLDGDPISLSAYRGKVVLLDFWATWCGPCVGEMPNVKRVFEKYRDRDFDVIGISLDTDEAALRTFIEENNLPWRQIFSGEGWDSPLARQFGIRGIPAPWLMDRNGKLLSPHARGAELERLVSEMIEG